MTIEIYNIPKNFKIEVAIIINNDHMFIRIMSCFLNECINEFISSIL